MSVWFEGTEQITCSLPQVGASLDDYGVHFVGVVGLMPSLILVELVSQDNDTVTIRTNEGRMVRSNIRRVDGPDSISIEYDEEYQAGALVTTKAHFKDTYTQSGSTVEFHTEISGLESPGILGFFYRKLGSKSIGSAFLAAHKAYLETL